MTARSLIALALACAACSAPTGEVGSGYRKVLETLSDPPTKLDILFVIDDSATMADNQNDLVEAARTELFSQLVTMDGTPPDLHLAVVSTSVNVAGQGVSGCDNAATPNQTLPDGRFLLGPWHDRPQQFCPGITGNFLIDSPDGAGGRTRNFSGTIEDNFACIARLSDQGCGIEQMLEAMRRSLSGEHAENAGFLRDDAMLLVVFLTDEDEESVVDGVLWRGTGAAYFTNDLDFEYGVVCDQDVNSVGPHTNCMPRANPAAIHGLDEYVAFLRSLKADPSLVMVAGINPPAGPVNVFALPDPPVLTLEGACTPPPGPCANNPALTCPRDPVLPAIRLNAFLGEFPARYSFSSLCDPGTAMRVRRIARSVAGVMTNNGCLIDTATTISDSCAAYDVAPDGTKTTVGLAISEDADACDYTSLHLRAEVGAITPGHTVEVYCVQ